MIQGLYQSVRVYFAEAWLSYHGRFAITNPFGYIASKLGWPFFLMLFFLFMGKFVGFADPAFIVIGNVLLIPTSSSLSAITLAIADERQYGTLSYILGSPAARAPIFLGRAFFYILDGFVTAILGLLICALVFHIDLTQVNLLFLLLCIVLLTISASGIGFLFGSISLISRDGWTILNTFISLFYILIGVNIPIDTLPGILKYIGWYLPLTRGIVASRMVLKGAAWAEVGGLIGMEVLVGMIYLLAGYVMFLIIEKRSMHSGTLDAM